MLLGGGNLQVLQMIALYSLDCYILFGLFI